MTAATPLVPPWWAWPVLLHVLLLSAILATTTRTSVTAIAGLAYLGGGAYQITVLHVPTEFWAHILFGLALSTGATYVLRGDGGPLAIKRSHGMLLILMSSALLIGEYKATKINSMHSFAHAMIVVLMLSIGLAATVSGAIPPSKKLSTVRALHDGAAIAGIGLILMRHLHDTAPLSVRFHEVQGMGVVLLGASVIISSLVHARLPRNDGAATLVRLCCAMLWCLNGLWLFHMACFIYAWPGRQGLHIYLWPNAAPEESVNIYLAADSWLAAIFIAAWHWGCGEREAQAASRADERELKDEAEDLEMIQSTRMNPIRVALGPRASGVPDADGLRGQGERAPLVEDGGSAHEEAREEAGMLRLFTGSPV